MNDNWIWLPSDIYPSAQKTRFDSLSDQDASTYTVAEFKRSYDFKKNIASLSVRFSADTELQLYCNGAVIATGPSVVGGDFLGNGKAREWYYADNVRLEMSGHRLEFFARVKMCPIKKCEFSKGHGGFMLSGEVIFEDGTSEPICTDETWLARQNKAYDSAFTYDGSISPDSYVNAERIEDIWLAKDAPIPVRSESEIEVGKIELAPGEEITTELTLDMIYGGFLHISAETDGIVDAHFTVLELAGEREDVEFIETEHVRLGVGGDYRGFNLHSAGNIVAHVRNVSDTPSALYVGLIRTHYPVELEAHTTTSDEGLNDILRVCAHTLKYCRQTHHLDSFRHCEPLACTGDYYIETLMTAFSFGDMRLSEFDIERMAQLLLHNDGRMFHTTYSLIWVRMLYDTYMMTANRELLESCREALRLLLARFERYAGENGLIESPPDYMFVDWIYIDEISMHHPPKALGQTVMNMLYFMALGYAARIYELLGDSELAAHSAESAERLRFAVNTQLYDAERGIYFEGLNTPTEESLIGEWQPKNVEKRYYLKQSNIMAAYTSICDDDTARRLIDKVVNDEIEGDVQPYFLHYLLEAIYTHGQRERYTLKVIDRWRAAVEECPRGLAEGFVPPEPTYNFDHSHAWGGTPLYSLPRALLGLSIDDAGYKRISLSPSLLGLEAASVELCTPYGILRCEMEQGKEPRIVSPPEIEIVI